MTAKALRWALAASLVLNVFLVGGMAGAAYQWVAHGRPEMTVQDVPDRGAGGAPGTRAAAPPRGLKLAAEGLSAEQQQSFRRSLREARQEARPHAEAARQGRREVLALLAAPQLDRAALERALARTRQSDMALRLRVERGVVDFAQTLSPEDRATLAAGLARRGLLQLPASAAQAPASGH